MEFILGVDAGNTKTIAMIANQDGIICGSGRSGCGDIYGAKSPDAAIANVHEAINKALDAAGLKAKDLKAGGFSMAGADWPEDYELLENEFARIGISGNVAVVNDAIGGLRAGAPEGYGISVVLGTYGAIGARAPDGRIWHGSFWIQSIYPNEIVRKIYNAMIMADLGLAPKTDLTPKVLELHNKATVEEMLHHLTHRKANPSVKNGQLIGVLLDQAFAGDIVSLDIIQQYGNRCGDFAIAAAKKVNLDTRSRFPLVFSGGMLRHSSNLLMNAIATKICFNYPNAKPKVSSFEPVIGAVLIGFDATDLPITANVYSNLRESMPDFSLFSTL